MATAVKQTLTQLLQAPPAQSPGAALRANGGDTAANAFSQTLERKMAEPERAPEPQAQRPQESARSQERQGVDARQAQTEKPAETAEPTRDSATAKNESAPARPAEAKAKDTAEATDAKSATPEAEGAETAAEVADPASSPELIAAAPAALAVDAAKAAKPGAESAAAAVSLADGKSAGKQAATAGLTAGVLPEDKAADGKAQLKGEVRADIGNGKSAAARMTDADIKPGATVVREGAASFAEQLDQRMSAGMKPGESLPMTQLNGQSTATGLTAASGAPAQQPLPAAVKAALPSHLGTPVTSQDWPDAVGNRVMWLAGKDESKAELILTPPSLGKLEISLTVTGDTTTAQFTAATPAAREALEQAMPRLREMLEQAGITLAESNVNTASQDQASDGGRNGQGRNGRHGGGADMAMNTVGTPAGHWIARGEGMIDTFA